MTEEVDLITDMSFGSQSSTPKCRGTDRQPLTPATASRIIERMAQTVDELLVFRQAENDGAPKPIPVDELESLRLSLHDANILHADNRKEISELKSENVKLKDEIKQTRDLLTQQQKDYELKMFRLQKELEHKNLEIVDLRKEKSDFDYRMNLLESRQARKIEELTLALNQARSGIDMDITKLLTSELDESKGMIENLKKLLNIQTSRGDLLSAAFAESIENFEQISIEINQVFKEINNNECLQFEDLELMPFEAIELPEFNFNCFEELNDEFKCLTDGQLNEMTEPAKNAISYLSSWCRSLLDKWSNDLQSNENLNQIEELTDVKNESGMTTYLSAAEDYCETILPYNELQDFAKNFAEYLIENQVFHPDDVPPTDTGVFHFLLDRYLLLVETYHNAKDEFEKTIAGLEQEHTMLASKTEKLMFQISELEISDSSFCDTSVTGNSVDFDRDFRSSTMCDLSICASMIADASKDPLEITMCTPEKRINVQTPQSRIPRSNRNSFKPSTPRIDEEPVMMNPPSIIKTPVQRLLCLDACSTAKKSVKFKSPLLARADIEAENARLKSDLFEKIAIIERLLDNRVENAAELEQRVSQLEQIAEEAKKNLEQFESEFQTKRENLEEELASVSRQLAQLTNKLIVEAINLDPALEAKIQNYDPSAILTILLETIITRFAKAQEDEKLMFEKERSEWSDEMAQKTAMELKIDELLVQITELTNENAKNQGNLEERIAGLEEDGLRLVTDNAQLERDNVELNKNYKETVEKMADSERNHAAELTALNENMNLLKLELMEKISGLELQLTDAKNLLENGKNSQDTELNGEIERLIDEKSTLEASLAEKQSAINQLQEELQKSVSKIAGLEMMVNSLEEKMIQLQDDRDKEIVQQVLLREKAVEELAENLKIHQFEVNAKNEEIESIKAEYLKIIETLNATIRDKTAHLEQLNETVANLKNEADLEQLSDKMVQELKNEMENLKINLAAMLEEKTKSNELLNAAMDEKADLESKLKEIVDKLSSVEEMTEKMAQDLTAAEEKLKIAENNLSVALDEKIILESQIEDFGKKSSDVDELVSNLVSTEEKLKTVENQLSVSLEEKIYLEAEIEELNRKSSDVDELVKKLMESTAILATREETLKTAENQLNVALNDKFILESQLRELGQKSTDDFVRKLKEAEDKLEVVEKQLSEALEQKNSLEAKIQEIGEKSLEVEDLTKKLAETVEFLASTEEKLKIAENQLTATLAEKLDLECQLQEIDQKSSELTKKLAEAEEKLQTNENQLTAALEAQLLELGQKSSDADDLTKKLAETVEFLASTEEKLKTAENQLIAAQAEKSDLESQIEEIRQKSSEVEDLTKKLLEADEKFQTIENQLEIAVEQKINLESQLQELGQKSSEAEDLTKKLTETAELLASTEEKLQTVENHLVAAQAEKSDLESQIEGIRQKSSEVEDLTKKLTVAEEKFQTIENQLTVVLEQKTNLESQLQELGQNSSEAEDLTKKLSETQNLLKSTKENLEESEKQKSDLESQLQELHKKSSDLSETLAATQDKLQKSENDQSAALDKINALESEIHNLNALIQELTTTHEKMEAEKNSLLEKETELQKMLEDSYATNETLKTDNVKLEKETENLLTRLNDANSVISDLENQMEKLKIDISAEKSKTVEELKMNEKQLADVLDENKSLKLKLEEQESEKLNQNNLFEQLNLQIEELTANKEKIQAEKKSLFEKLSEIQKLLDESLISNKALKTDNIKLEKECENLLKQLNESNFMLSDLENQLGQFKLTEGAILRKLAEKQASDEAALRFKSELSQLQLSWDNQQNELETLRSELSKKSDSENNFKQIMDNLAHDKDVLNTSLEKNRNRVKDLENVVNERSVAINGLNQQVEKLSTDNAQLCELLGEIQQKLKLPEEAVSNLSIDTNTKSYLRLFKENEENRNQELIRLKTDREAMLNEQQRLSIEVEKLTSEKVHFEIKAAELDAFGKNQEEQINALSGKLARLEASLSRRSRRSDPIGPRRLEKLEEMNKTLHELIMGLINTMQMPNAEKIRLISQREVDSSAKHILEHAAKIAVAANSLNSLKEQVKNLDQENQELSDNMETLLKDNSRLELRILELQNQSGKVCAVCADLKKSLKAKTDNLAKIESEVKELKDKIRELDQENEELSENVEALLKDNSKLEMKILEIENNADDCSKCKNLKTKLSKKEDEIESMKLKANDSAFELEQNLQTLRKKCENLESSLKDKEQQLLRALNNISRTDAEVRMCGSGSGLTKEISQGEKIRSLSKDNTMLKELLRQRAQTIKKLENELKNLDAKPLDVMNSNSMNSPIRERNYSLRTRGDVAGAYKRALRPDRSIGSENIY